MVNLNIMYKVRLNKINVIYVKKMKNKNLLKLNVNIISVWNVLMNYLSKENIINVQNVENKIGLYQ